MVEIRRKGNVMVAKRDTDFGVPEFIRLQKGEEILNAAYKGFSVIMAQLDQEIINKYFDKDPWTDEDFDFIKKEIVKNAVLF